MAGRHASTRVDSGAMRFRPGGASTRRPNPISNSILASATPNPSRSNSSGNQDYGSQYNPTENSDTEGGPSRGVIPTITRSHPARVAVTPGLTRNATRQGHTADSSYLSRDSFHSNRPDILVLGASASAATVVDPLGVSQGSSTSELLNGGRAISDHPGRASENLQYHTILPTPTTSQNMSLSHPILASTMVTTMQHEPPRSEEILQLQTPPPTQTVSSQFPVDPDLLGFPEQHPHLGFHVKDLFDVAHAQPESVEQPILPELLPGIGNMPPPPLLPQEPSAQPSGETIAPDAGPSASGERARKLNSRSDKTRKRRRIAPADEQDDENEGSERPTRRKRSTGTRTRRPKTIEEKIEAFEQRAAQTAAEGGNEPLDPTMATMASLCESDLPNGRISSKYVEKGVAYVKHVEARRQRILERTAERLQKLRASGLDPDHTQPASVKQPEPSSVGLVADEPGEENRSASPRRRELGASLSPSPERDPEQDQSGEKFAETAVAPQIRFVNGEMVLDEDSQFYDRAGPVAQDEDSMVVVDEADSTRFSNSSSFMKKAGSRGSRWTAEETELFYWCLSAFGEDYENIARYLGRTPLQCKNKTKSEDRRGNEKRITMAIKTRIPLDLEEFGRITGRDFSGPPPTVRTPTAPPRSEYQEQEPVEVSIRAKGTSSTPATLTSAPKKKRAKPVAHADEEIMTMEEYLRGTG